MFKRIQNNWLKVNKKEKRLIDSKVDAYDIKIRGV